MRPRPERLPSAPGQPQPLPDRRTLISAGAGLAAAVPFLGCRSTAPGPEAPDAEELQRLDELFPELADQSASVEPVRQSERAARRVRLGGILAALGLDALVCEAGPTMTYLSGVSWGRSERLFALVVLADSTHFWVCPAFERERAQLEIAEGSGGEIVTWQEDVYPYRPLAETLRQRRVERVAVEPALRHVFVHGLGQVLGPERIAFGAQAVLELRGCKDAHELALLRRANELTQRALVALAPRLRAGMTGSEIGAMITRAQERLGLENVWNLSLIGPASAYPHGTAQERPLQRGDVILIDTGGTLHGYNSDNTRTWVFDAAPTREVERVWNAVRDAQRSAFDAIRPGVRCATIDRVARELLDARGFGPGYRTFHHRLGHGIGLEGHEDPYFDGGSEVVLRPGMTLSDEPGVYLYGSFGVRIEDIIAVTEDACDHFGSWQEQPTSPA